MSTRHEAELQEIEGMMRDPRKAGKVTDAMRTHVSVQRERERERAQRTRELGDQIHLCWADGKEPEKWEEALAQVTFGNETRAYLVQPYEEVDGRLKLKSRIVAKGYRKMVEEWALWKWHVCRGSEVDDADNFVVDCKLPEMVWDVAEVKRGPGRPKKEQAEA